MSGHRLPLEGIRVVDFTWVAAGPRATRTFANFGAEVIKVESTRRLDLSRGRPPLAEGKSGVNVSGSYNNYNVDKMGITLNLGSPQGLEIVKGLISISDIVADNFTAGVMEKWGLGYSDLVKIKPDIIVLSMPVMGGAGPRRDYGGYGMGIQAIAGINYITGPAHQMPVGTGIAYPDAGPNPRHAAIAVLAALHHRNKTGQGQYIELAQYESTVCFTGPAILDYSVNRQVSSRNGNRLPYAVPHGAYRCLGDDRWCVIAVFNDQEWRAFRRALGGLAWTEEARFATLEARKQNEDELDRMIEGWTMERTAEQVMMLLQQQGVAAGVVENGEDLLVHDPQMKARGHYVVLEHPEAGKVSHDGVTCSLSLTPGAVRVPAPILGQHNEYVYQELLGMSQEEMDGYIVAGALD